MVFPGKATPKDTRLNFWITLCYGNDIDNDCICNNIDGGSDGRCSGAGGSDHVNDDGNASYDSKWFMLLMVVVKVVTADGKDGGEGSVVKTDDDDSEDSFGVDDSVESNDCGGDPCCVFDEKVNNSSDCDNCSGDSLTRISEGDLTCDSIEGSFGKTEND